jgi:uncharacterized protein (TIGR00369 family)
MAAEPPPGFAPAIRAPFVNHVGPILQAVDDPPGCVRLGLQVAEVHSNTLGLMHGGMIATMVDSAMARAVIKATSRRVVTLKMTLEYLEAVRQGDWVEAHATVVFQDEQTATTDCDVRVGGQLRAKGLGVFRLLRPIQGV